MAKKKKMQQDKPREAEIACLDNIANLKTLNGFLLKETVEKRESIKMLQESHGQLQSQNQVYEDRIVVQDIEQAVCYVVIHEVMKHEFVKKEVIVDLERKMKLSEQDSILKFLELQGTLDQTVKDLICCRGDLDKVTCARDQALSELDLTKDEAEGLRLMIEKLSHDNRVSRNEIEEMKENNYRILLERTERETTFESLLAEKDYLHKNFQESRKELDDLKIAMDVMKNEHCKQINDLQEQVHLLSDSLTSEQNELETTVKEKDLLQRRLMDFSNLIGELNNRIEDNENEKLEVERLIENRESKLNDLQQEISNLQFAIVSYQKSCQTLEETNHRLEIYGNTLKDSYYQVLCERDALMNDLAKWKKEEEELRTAKRKMETRVEIATKELVERESKILLLVQEIEQLKTKMKEIEKEKDQYYQGKIELELLSSSFEREISALEKASIEHSNTNSELMNDMTQLKSNLNSVISERDIARKELDLHKVELGTLKQENLKLEQEISIARDELKKQIILNNEHKEEKALLENRLLEVENRAETAELCREQSLSLLKSIYVMMNHSSSESSDGKVESSIETEQNDEATHTFQTELDTLKNSFKYQFDKIAEMKQKIETLKESMEESQKMRQLWSRVSSATAIIFAASIAYIVKFR